MTNNRWLSVPEIAAYLGIERETVYRWIGERQMPGHKIGRLWKFNRDEVDEWVRSHGAEDAPPPGNEILQLLRKHAADMRRRYSARRIGLFGSFARGTANERSDVDILVELEKPTFDHYMDLQFFLEDLLGRPVDLVLADSVKPRLKALVSEETVYV